MIGPGSIAPRTAARSLSLRGRLTLWVIAIALVIQLTLGAVVLLYQTASIDRFFSDRLRIRSRALGAAVRAARCEVVSADLRRMSLESGASLFPERSAAALYDAGGQPIATTIDPPMVLADSFPVREARVGGAPVIFVASVAGLEEAGPSRARLSLQRISDGEGREFVLLIAMTDSNFESMVAVARRVLLLALPVGVLGAGVAGWLVAGVVVHPLRKAREIAAGIVFSEAAAPPEEAGPGLQSAEFQELKTTLDEVRERVRSAYMAGDRLIANVSHEIRTPIAVLLAEAQTVDSRRLSPDARRFVRSVIDEMRRLNRTVESSLLLTKIRAGKSLMDHAPCEINEFVMDAVMACARMARQHNVALMPMVGAAEPARRVVGDCDLLRVMLDNLIRNAIRFSPEGSRVIIRVEESADPCTVSVRDFGPGIPEEIRGTLFEPLVQGPAEEGRGRGIGLGLTIAQSIAELHGGRIGVANAPGGGCEFTVTLPCEPSQPAREAGTQVPACGTDPPADVDALTAASAPRETGDPRSG